jgi:hypothetical protein
MSPSSDPSRGTLAHLGNSGIIFVFPLVRLCPPAEFANKAEGTTSTEQQSRRRGKDLPATAVLASAGTLLLAAVVYSFMIYSDEAINMYLGPWTVHEARRDISKSSDVFVSIVTELKICHIYETVLYQEHQIL